jgi:hypothetical protein
MVWLRYKILNRFSFYVRVTYLCTSKMVVGLESTYVVETPSGHLFEH